METIKIRRERKINKLKEFRKRVVDIMIRKFVEEYEKEVQELEKEINYLEKIENFDKILENGGEICMKLFYLSGKELGREEVRCKSLYKIYRTLTSLPILK